MNLNYDNMEDAAKAGLTVGAIVLILSLLMNHCRAQSIGLDLSVHNDGTRQYGLAVTDLSHCFGGYYNRVIKEGANADHLMNRGVCDFEGWTAGIIYTTVYERISFVSVGTGKVTESRYDCNHLAESSKMVLELKTGIILCRWCDIVFGINSLPAVVSGLRLKINL